MGARSAELLEGPQITARLLTSQTATLIVPPFGLRVLGGGSGRSICFVTKSAPMVAL